MCIYTDVCIYVLTHYLNYPNEIPTTANIKSEVFLCDLPLCTFMNRDQVFTGTAAPFLRFESISSTMEMKAVGSSETLIYGSTELLDLRS